KAALHAIGQTIIDWYSEQKYPFVDVAVPAGQDVTNGVVQVVVTESHAGKVTTRGNKWFSSDLLVNIVAERDSTPGVTNFVVDTVQEKFPFRAYAGYDNTGTAVLGHDRWNV